MYVESGRRHKTDHFDLWSIHAECEIGVNRDSCLWRTIRVEAAAIQREMRGLIWMPHLHELEQIEVFMSIDIAAPGIDAFVQTSDRDFPDLKNLPDVKASYDGSNVVYRLLRMETWGPSLMNLGYYPYTGLFSFLNLVTNQELAQRKLVTKAIELLQVRRRLRVLDVACGRGKSSFMVSAMNPEATVVGLDLLSQNIQVAKTLFDQNENLSYRTGNAMSLDFPDSSFDRVMCLEAAFHFPDRDRFLREAFRVARPGAKLVVVDFAWADDGQRIHRDDAETRLVRNIWQWDDLYSISEYERVARTAGFHVSAMQDWSSRVTGSIQGLFEFVSHLGNTDWGRQLLEWRNPLYRSISKDDWKDAARAVRAHEHGRKYVKYVAFVFEKK